MKVSIMQEFDNIDETRIYSSNWMKEVGCNDFYVNPLTRYVPNVTAMPDNDSVPANFCQLGKVKYITKEEYNSAPRNWSMGGKISDELFVDSWVKASKSQPFFTHIEEHVRRATEGRVIIGEGADCFRIKRIMVKAKSLSFPFPYQHEARLLEPNSGYPCYQLTLLKKRYFKVESYQALRAIQGFRDEVPWVTLLLNVPAYVTRPLSNYTRDMIENRRLSLKKKGFKLRKKRFW